MTVRTTSGNDVWGGLGTPSGPGASPAGTRPARPVERRGAVRPGGRRGATPLPPARPPVAGGHGPGRAGRAGWDRGPLPTAAVARRRRLVALVLTAVALLAVGVLLGLASSSTAEAAGAGATTLTVVRPGETLQDVARRAVPGGDERELAARIRELNALPDSGVSPGRPLVVPGGR